MPYFNNNDDAYRLFSRDILQKADEEINRLKKEISDNKEKNVKRIDAEIHSRVFRNLEIDINDLNADFSANLSRVRNEYTRILMKKRRELLDSIVEAARNKCIEFVNSDKYPKFIDAKMSGISERFDKKSVEFKVRRNDKVAIDMIKNKFEGNYEIKEINEIEIGGFSAICYEMGIMLDETIDARLREKQLWFYEHSDLASK
jgi:vacuolar-type H+-ATPase subunit E/Vma4